jgi:hypothetical protein
MYIAIIAMNSTQFILVNIAIIIGTDYYNDPGIL